MPTQNHVEKLKSLSTNQNAVTRTRRKKQHQCQTKTCGSMSGANLGPKLTCRPLPSVVARIYFKVGIIVTERLSGGPGGYKARQRGNLALFGLLRTTFRPLKTSWNREREEEIFTKYNKESTYSNINPKQKKHWVLKFHKYLNFYWYNWLKFFSFQPIEITHKMSL